MSTKFNPYQSSAQFSLNDPIYYAQWKRFAVSIPILVSGNIRDHKQHIEIAARDKKEAIKSAKKHFRAQLAQAIKEMEVYERD